MGWIRRWKSPVTQCARSNTCVLVFCPSFNLNPMPFLCPGIFSSNAFDLNSHFARRNSGIISGLNVYGDGIKSFIDPARTSVHLGGESTRYARAGMITTCKSHFFKFDERKFWKILPFRKQGPAFKPENWTLSKFVLSYGRDKQDLH